MGNRRSEDGNVIEVTILHLNSIFALQSQEGAAAACFLAFGVGAGHVGR